MNVELSRRRMLALGAVPVVASLGIGAVEASAAQPRPEALNVAGASRFVAVPPSRLADTRNGTGHQRLDANTIRIEIAGRNGVPGDAKAAVINVTATNTNGPGFVSIYPSGSARPNVSSLNVERAGQIVPNLVTVQLGTNGSVDIFCQSRCDIVVDINGAYVPVDDAVREGRFVALGAVERVLDTRSVGVVNGSSTIRVNMTSVVPASATSVVVTLTVTESRGPGFWTAFPAGTTMPNSSSANTDAANQTRANQAIIPVGTAGGIRGIDVFASAGGHLIVDVAGYFTGPTDPVSADGLFIPNAPYRALDTRFVASLGQMYPTWVAEFDFLGRANAQAVVINLTATQTRGVGFFTAYPAGTNRPLASNLNATAKEQTVANHAIVRNSTRGVALFTQAGAALVVDVAGYFLGIPSAAPLLPVVNVIPSPPPPAPLPYQLWIPKINQVNTVLEGVGSNIVNRGYVGHWPGTGLAGETSHIVLFAHRTEHGGIWRYIHYLTVGDKVYITAADGRVFEYTYSRRDITGPGATAIYNAGLKAALPSLSLVACSKTNYEPTSTSYRIVVTFTLTDEW